MIGPKVDRASEAEEQRAYEVVTERDEQQCQRCWRGGVAQRDHRKNRSQGGRTAASNLHLLCPECHLWKTDHPVEAARDGWGVPGWADPAEFPARRWLRTAVGTLRQAWVLYDDAGTWTEISAEQALRRMEGGAR
ncbi:HNH endonuclease signature motif containing protein [Curtobacterium sp. MCBA15_012]|uniref:HNH endonuclease signature motif containing protein n=1 Tax=Curtobacterium sp. MCBA15_012 TaxID=1898738 RepID=UPI0008DCE549|nr:HNH endonuclease signature motif containing protein [Curtobacterium sp. MCBA15_012]WIA99718.1 HNH endonuclease signature motif containing protein [Curtobacterium sp. MCBA15_012]